MSNVPNYSNDQKSVTPPTPQQQTQNTPSKPAGKPERAGEVNLFAVAALR